MERSVISVHIQAKQDRLLYRRSFILINTEKLPKDNLSGAFCFKSIFGGLWFEHLELYGASLASHPCTIIILFSKDRMY